MVARLKPRAAVLLGAAGVLVVLLAGWFLFLSPQRSTVADLDARIDEADAKLVVAEGLKRQVKQPRRAEDDAELVKAMPPDVRMSSILRELSTAAAASGVRIKSVGPQPGTPASGYQVIPIALTLEGRYFAVVEFLRFLRSRADVTGSSEVKASGRLYSVDSVTFGGAGDSGALSVTLALNAYSLTGGSSAAAGTAVTPTTASAAPTTVAAGSDR